MIKVAVNGFGRIGRSLSKLILADKHFKLVLINDIYDEKTMKYLFKHDSVYKESRYDLESINITNHKNIEDLKLNDVDIVFECSGIYNSKKDLSSHIKNGAKKVILSAHSKDVKNLILGVNEDDYGFENIVAASSCTANCIAPILKSIEKFVIVKNLNATTIHSYTSDQNLLDNKSKDIRRCRASAINIIPLTSNVKNTVSYFFPHLQGKIDSKSIRVPIENGVLIDLHIQLSKKIDYKDVKNLILEQSSKDIEISKDFIVSRDIRNNPHATVVDMELLDLIDEDLLRVVLWQDNEYAYAKKVLELAKLIGKDL